MLNVGDKVPAFTLMNTKGDKVKPGDWKGRRVALYFYPKDDTPGCTKEACSLRDGISKLKKAGIEVYGISPDSVESHQRFTAKYKLPFPLLADPDHKIADKFGVWVEKNMYGKKSMGIKRSTFIIDEDGKIADMIKSVKTDDHANQILERLK